MEPDDIADDMANAIQDCVMPGEKVLAEQEKAYRRGFAQGAYECFVQLTQEGRSESEIEKWINYKLMDWRREMGCPERGSMVKWKQHPMP
jgi:hypothetical protein